MEGKDGVGVTSERRGLEGKTIFTIFSLPGTKDGVRSPLFTANSTPRHHQSSTPSSPPVAPGISPSSCDINWPRWTIQRKPAARPNTTAAFRSSPEELSSCILLTTSGSSGVGPLPRLCSCFNLSLMGRDFAATVARRAPSPRWTNASLAQQGPSVLKVDAVICHSDAEQA